MPLGLHPSPSSPAQPSTPRVDLSAVLGDMWHGVWQSATQHPVTGLVLATSVLVAATGFVRAALYPVRPVSRRDPVRRFSRSDKAMILARAGERCERHVWPFGRCRETERLEADHVHPHSRGGWTDVANGQALCRRHNRGKRASVPFGWQLRRLAKRRASYFPVGMPAHVVRREPARQRGSVVG